MGWADAAIKELQAGHEVQIRPKSNSTSGRIESGQFVTGVSDNAVRKHLRTHEKQHEQPC